jgi:hypothetical protein
MFINLLVENDNLSERVDDRLWQAQVRDTLDVMAVALCAPFSQPTPWSNPGDHHAAWGDHAAVETKG